MTLNIKDALAPILLTVLLIAGTARAVPSTGVGGTVGVDHITAIDQIATALKTGDDAKLVTGTVTVGECMQYNADGDAVGAGSACGVATLPVVDTTEIAKGSVDPTKQVRFDVSGVGTGNTTIISVPDFGVNLGALNENSLAADSVGSSEIKVDAVGTLELDDGADTATSGHYVRVDTGDQAGFEYRSTTQVLSDIAAEPANADIAKTDENEIIVGEWDVGGGELELPNGTIAGLGAATLGRIAIITDGDGDADCTVGGQSTQVSCMANGSTWEPTGDSAASAESMHWGAGAMLADGTECSDPSAVTINSGPKVYTIACAHGTSETDGFIYGNTIVPKGFDKTQDVTFMLLAYLTADNGAGAWHGQIDIQCQGEGEIIDSTWGTQIGLDITPVTGDVVNDVVGQADISAAVDTDTTGENCDPKDTLFWRWLSCDTDATPTSGCTSSAGFENDMSILGMRMDYTVNPE